MKQHVISVAVSDREHKAIKRIAEEWARTNRIRFSRGCVATYIRELVARAIAKVEIPTAGGAE